MLVIGKLMSKQPLVERVAFLVAVALIFSALAIAVVVSQNGVDQALRSLCDLF